MSTNHHTAIATGAALDASTFNTPLGTLDAAITDNATATTDLGFADLGIVTLASDVLAATGSKNRNIVVAAQSGTADDLIEITGLTVGDEIILRADTGDTITVKHNNGGATIKIHLLGDADVTLDEINGLRFVYIATNIMAQINNLSAVGVNDNYVANEGSDYTTTSASFVDIDATNLSLTIITTGGDVKVHFHGVLDHTATQGFINFDVDVDATRDGGDDGYIASSATSGNDKTPITFTRLITGLSAGSHTFKLQWKTSASTATLYAGAGTTNLDVHPQFWVEEID